MGIRIDFFQNLKEDAIVKNYAYKSCGFKADKESILFEPERRGMLSQL